MSNVFGFLDYITDPADGGKNIKKVIDHVRNYMISGAVMGLGVLVIRHGSAMTNSQEIGWVTGPIILSIGFLLYSINFIVFVRCMVSKEFSKNKKISMIIYMLIAIVMVFVMSDITYSVLYQALSRM
tara:strand:+ start:83 stop:463 length:381 start_codon:yes stop_codon:yes gene_type:complete